MEFGCDPIEEGLAQRTVVGGDGGCYRVAVNDHSFLSSLFQAHLVVVGHDIDGSEASLSGDALERALRQLGQLADVGGAWGLRGTRNLVFVFH